MPARPAPTALKIVRGDRPSRVNQHEPQPPIPVDPMPAPEWLSDIAREVWERLAPQMHPIKLITQVDVDFFAAGCESVATWRAALEQVRTDGVVLYRKDGAIKHPAAQVMRDSYQSMLAWAREFGLTPSARSGVEVPELEEGAAERYLS